MRDDLETRIRKLQEQIASSTRMIEAHEDLIRKLDPADALFGEALTLLRLFYRNLEFYQSHLAALLGMQKDEQPERDVD